MKDSSKARVWKLASLVVVLMIMLNPEMAQLALFIDAVGLEAFLLLIEIQVYAIAVLIVNTRFRQMIGHIKYLCQQYHLRILKQYAANYSATMAVTAAALVMHVLVISAAIGVAVHS